MKVSPSGFLKGAFLLVGTARFEPTSYRTPTFAAINTLCFSTGLVKPKIYCKLSALRYSGEIQKELSSQTY